MFTTRAHGNLSSVGGEGCEHGLQARERLRERLGVGRLARGYQIHGSVVGRVFADATQSGAVDATPAGATKASPPQPASGEEVRRSIEQDSERQPSFEADGHAVAAAGVAAMVLTADCIPVALGAQGAVAALHAGWRGLAAGVLEQGVRALREVGGRGDVVALVGPCAGECCYEVGEQVHAAFGGAHRSGRLIDLRAIAHERLRAAGVAQVIDAQACTICDERFFSHRREGARAGRQGCLAWLS